MGAQEGGPRSSAQELTTADAQATPAAAAQVPPPAFASLSHSFLAAYSPSLLLSVRPCCVGSQLSVVFAEERRKAPDEMRR
jgi:hypothetical protein